MKKIKNIKRITVKIINIKKNFYMLESRIIYKKNIERALIIHLKI